MNEFWRELQKWLPIVWGILLTLIITAGWLSLCVLTFRLLFMLLGVM